MEWRWSWVEVEMELGVELELDKKFWNVALTSLDPINSMVIVNVELKRPTAPMAVTTLIAR